VQRWSNGRKSRWLREKSDEAYANDKAA